VIGLILAALHSCDMHIDAKVDLNQLLEQASQALDHLEQTKSPRNDGSTPADGR
jgi:hypothetical protein